MTNADSTSVFDAALPTLDYDVTTLPAQVYPQLLAAQQQAPIAMGPFGPEVLSYDLVRSVLCDSRFETPCGLHLAVQGVTSGPLWDKVVSSLMAMEGHQHQRIRSLVSKAFTPRAVERLNATIVGIIDDIVEPSVIRATATSSQTSPVPTPYPSSVHC
jgi:cytochrome P450